MIYAHIFNPKKEEQEEKLTVMTDEMYEAMIEKTNKLIRENKQLKAELNSVIDENIKMDDELIKLKNAIGEVIDILEVLISE